METQQSCGVLDPGGITNAYNTLIHATLEERERYARDMVFGQNTGLWTPEMRTLTDGIMRLLAPVFAAQHAPPINEDFQERCTACENGVVVMQGANDFIPVPLACGVCGGLGTVNRAVALLRQNLKAAVTSPPASKKKKK